MKNIIISNSKIKDKNNLEQKTEPVFKNLE